MLKKDSKPICMTHKREVHQICLDQRCSERERFLCQICLLNSHKNHEENFISITEFQKDILTYVNKRLEERASLQNQVKKQLQQSFGSTSSSRQYQNVQKGSSNESKDSNNTTISKQSSNPNFIYDSMLKQKNKIEKLSEQFILERIANDIDSLFHKIRMLESIEASNELIEFCENFSNIFKNFLEYKHFEKAKIFWQELDTINEDHSGNFNKSSLNFNSQPKCTNSKLQIQNNQSRISSISSSYSKQYKKQQPFMSLIKLFDAFNHIKNNYISKNPFGYICKIIYINSNYCLIPFSTSFTINQLALYDLKRCQIVKVQKVSLCPSYHLIEIDNIIYSLGLPQLFESNMEHENNEIFHFFYDFINLGQRPNFFFNFVQPTIHQYRVPSQIFQHSPQHQENIILISDSEEQQQHINQFDIQDDYQQINSPIFYSDEQIDNITNQFSNIDQTNIKVDAELQNISQSDYLNKELNLKPQQEDISQTNNNQSQLVENDIFNSHLPNYQQDQQKSKFESFSPIKDDKIFDDKQDNISIKKSQAKNKRNRNTLRRNNGYQTSSDSDSENCQKVDQNLKRNNQVNEKNPLNEQSLIIQNYEQSENQNSSEEIEEEKTKDKECIKHTNNNYKQNSSPTIDLDKSYQSIKNLNSQQNMNQINQEPNFSSESNILQNMIEFNHDQELDRNVITIDTQSELSQQELNYLQSQQQQIQQQFQNDQQHEQIDNYFENNDEILQDIQEQDQQLFHLLDINLNNEMQQNQIEFQYFNPKQYSTLLLQKVNDFQVFQVYNQNTIIIYKLNHKLNNGKLISKDFVIKTKNLIKISLMLTPIIMCVCERKVNPFNLTDIISFYNIKTKKIIKKINNICFQGEYIHSLKLGKKKNIICYKTNNQQFELLDWKTNKLIKKFMIRDGISFQNMCIFVEFFYHMYKNYDFDENKVYLEISDKTLQNTNFSENSQQYCIPYYTCSKDKTPEIIGVCYLQNKQLESMPLNKLNIDLSCGISQLQMSNDQLIVILRSGEIHHIVLKNSEIQQFKQQTIIVD